MVRTRLTDWLIRRLSRTTASGDVIPEVDGLRCIAISAVILHHITASYLTTTGRLGPVLLPAQWWDVFPQSRVIAVGYAGHFGVHLFFAISGFILALPFVRSDRQGTRRPPLGSYYLRRLVRLEPPYVLNILLSMLLIVVTNPGWRTVMPHLPASLLYLHGPLFGRSSPVNGLAWSLEVEVQFYLALPLLAAIFAVRPAVLRRLVMLSAMIGLAWLAQRFIGGDRHPRLQLSLLNHLHFFFAGFLLADLYEAHAAWGFRRRFAWDVVAALAGLGIFVILTRRYDVYYLTPVLIVVLYLGLFLGRIGHSCIRQRLVVVFGGMCYTTYLYHFMVISLLAPWTMRLSSSGRSMLGDLALQGVVLVPPILLVSSVFFVLVERPFMRMSAALSRRFRPAEA